MNRAITGNGEVAPKTRFLYHRGAVSADQHRFAGIKRVVVIKNKIMGEAGDRTVVGCHLAKVFADVFEAGELEGANRHRAEIYSAGLSGGRRILNSGSFFLISLASSPTVTAKRTPSTLRPEKVGLKCTYMALSHA